MIWRRELAVATETTSSHGSATCLRSSMWPAVPEASITVGDVPLQCQPGGPPSDDAVTFACPVYHLERTETGRLRFFDVTEASEREMGEMVNRLGCQLTSGLQLMLLLPAGRSRDTATIQSPDLTGQSPDGEVRSKGGRPHSRSQRSRHADAWQCCLDGSERCLGQQQQERRRQLEGPSHQG